MEKLIETREQYNEIKDRVFRDIRTIENTYILFSRNCFKEEYIKYIKALNELKKVFIFSRDEKEESFDEVFDRLLKDNREMKELARDYIKARKEEQRKEAESIAFK